MISRTLGHYVLCDKLGSGAMGDVYVADDARLGRRVALKILAARLTGKADGLERFEREAKALGALNHPNITTIHSIEECEGVRFLTMELVEGETLDRLIPESGLGLDRILSIAIPVAGALDAAHGKGIVHRDLKPANVMVTEEDRVKILDFGLSKLREDESRRKITEPVTTITEDGALVGTLPYMSPEQVKAQDVDYRSDLFALGVLLYEMATGRRPFPETSAADLISAILRDDPPPLRRLRPELPSALGHLVKRCMEKEPDRRWQSAGDVRRELEAIAAGASTGAQGTSSIAVLPFADLSPNKDQDWFCAGLAEELIHALSKIRGLRVAARSSSLIFQGMAVDAVEVGRRLNVDVVLEGTVRKASDQLRITAELVDVEAGCALLSERYDCRTEEVFEVQERIARRIVEALRVALSPREWRAMRQFGTPVVSAYEYYLKGRKYLTDYSSRSMEFALELFHRSIDADSGFAPAYAGIAESCSFLYANADGKREHLDRALKASGEALQIGPLLAEAHIARAVALSLDRSDSEAERAFDEAIRLDAQSFEAHYFYARHCFERGKPARAIEHYERASELRREDYQVPLLVAQVYDDLGRTDESAAARRRGIAAAEERLKLNPDDSRALYMGANGLVALGETERGLKWARRAQVLSPGDPLLLYNLACIYALAGENECALDCIETCLRSGFSNLDWLWHDSNLTALRGDSRFATIVPASESTG